MKKKKGGKQKTRTSSHRTNSSKSKKRKPLIKIIVGVIFIVVGIGGLVYVVKGNLGKPTTVNEEQLQQDETKELVQKDEDVSIPDGATKIIYLGLNLEDVEVFYFDDKAVIRIPNASQKDFVLTKDYSREYKSGKTGKKDTKEYYISIKPKQTIELEKNEDKISILFNGDTVFRGTDKATSKLNELAEKAKTFIQDSDWYDNENYKNLKLATVKESTKCKENCYILTFEYLVPVKEPNQVSKTTDSKVENDKGTQTTEDSANTTSNDDDTQSENTANNQTDSDIPNGYEKYTVSIFVSEKDVKVYKKGTKVNLNQ